MDIGVGGASLDTEAAHYNSFEVGAKTVLMFISTPHQSHGE